MFLLVVNLQVLIFLTESLNWIDIVHLLVNDDTDFGCSRGIIFCEGVALAEAFIPFFLRLFRKQVVHGHQLLLLLLGDLALLHWRCRHLMQSVIFFTELLNPPSQLPQTIPLYHPQPIPFTRIAAWVLVEAATLVIGLQWLASLENFLKIKRLT